MQKYFLLLIFFPVFANVFLNSRIANTDNRKITKSFPVFASVSDGEKCTDCHSDLVGKGNAHPPATDDCLSCHLINLAEHKDNAKKGINLSEKMPELCYTCHDDTKKKIETSTHVHLAVNDKKNCAACHSPHSAVEKKLLVKKEKELCLSCHNKELTSKTGKIANIQRVIKTSKLEHAPVSDGCVGCHNPHASNNFMLLNKAFPSGQYTKVNKDSFALCFECHEAGLIENAKTTSATGFRNGDNNLHFLHINGDKGRTCTMCHNIHASVNNHLIESSVKFGNWEFKMNYLSDDKGGSCLPACHGEKKYIR